MFFCSPAFRCPDHSNGARDRDFVDERFAKMHPRAQPLELANDCNDWIVIDCCSVSARQLFVNYSPTACSLPHTVHTNV
jgi:hypothetical protein